MYGLKGKRLVEKFGLKFSAKWQPRLIPKRDVMNGSYIKMLKTRLISSNNNKFKIVLKTQKWPS
jgi:hypothetical protein